MKILVVLPRGRWNDVSYYYLFPLGLGYIASVLKQAGHDVTCYNLNHHAGTVTELFNDILPKNKYDFLCTGGLSASFAQIRDVADAARANNTKLIVGGGIISSEPELMFNALQAEYVVIGEGEKTIVELLALVAEKKDVGGVAGIGYRNETGKFICTGPRTAIEELDALPIPDFDGFEFGSYLDHQHPSDQYFYDIFDHPRVYPIVCSRSCPYLCTFCFHPAGNKYRQRSIDSIMDELVVNVKKYRINIIAIYDELFSNNLAWLNEFCARIKTFLKELSWECKWTCQMRVDRVDKAMLDLMRDAGCYMISYGFESYSLSVLKSMRKKIKPEQIDNAVHVTADARVSLQANFIFGDVAETAETAKETLKFWEEHAWTGIVLGFINPYPGTELYNHCIRKGIIKDRLDFIEHHIFDAVNMSNSMTTREFQDLQNSITRVQLKNRCHALAKSIKREPGGTYAFKVTCPFCHGDLEYKNYQVSMKHFANIMIYCRSCRKRFFVVSPIYKLIMMLLPLIYDLLPVKNLAYFFLRETTKIDLKRILFAFSQGKKRKSSSH